MVRVVTQARAEKRYRARVEAAGPLPADLAERVAGLELPLTLAQRTPARVARRRSDLVRNRRVLELSAVRLDDRHAEIELRTEAGTYVKELVSGDEGRTVPSLASILGVACAVTELDVLDVDFDPFGGGVSPPGTSA
jgi:tRNA pseudouridine synthase 10